MRWAAATALLVLALTVVDASVLVRHDVTTTPLNTVPVTLLAGAVGSTTLGTSKTSATTTGVAVAVLAVNPLKVVPGAQTWNVQVRATGATGMSGPETAIVALVGGTTQTITLTPSTSYPVTSGTVSLPTGGSNLSLTIATVVACAGCTLTLEFRLTPSGGSAPLLVYPYTLSTT